MGLTWLTLGPQAVTYLGSPDALSTLVCSNLGPSLHPTWELACVLKPCVGPDGQQGMPSSHLNCSHLQRWPLGRRRAVNGRGILRTQYSGVQSAPKTLQGPPEAMGPHYIHGYMEDQRQQGMAPG